MAMRRLDLELSEPLAAVQLQPAETGVGLIARWRGRVIGFALVEHAAGGKISAAALQEICGTRFAPALLAAHAQDELERAFSAPPPRPAPTLTVAICTKDRAPRLARLLASLDAVRARSPFSAMQVLVVDNAPSDDTTRNVVASHPWADYRMEPRAGLDFARNTALASATADLIAYLDDDVVVDRGWLDGLHQAWRGAPDAGGYTGLVLPFRLDTEAQVYFEAHGGFGRGFQTTEFRGSKYGNTLHPVGAGLLGAGCNMCFRRELLLSLGGFDEALDTGHPLPGGGDLDIFYRVLRSGAPMVYEPAYAVHHEHRETLPQLRRQYWSWGLGFMAYLSKQQRGDPALRSRHAAAAWWWFCDRGAAVARAALKRRRLDLAFAWAELVGGVQGALGEYGRSSRRSQRIREQTA